MIQLTYRLGMQLDLVEVLARIASHDAYRNASARLVCVLDASYDDELAAMELEQIAEILPEAHVVGMTLLGPITPTCLYATDTIITVLLFESSRADVRLYDCNELSPVQAAASFNAQFAGSPDMRGVFFLSSDMGLFPTPFVDAVARANPQVPVFGTQAGTNEIAVDRSRVFCGTAVLPRAIIAVAFSGKDLELFSSCNIGWKPLGREFTITKTGNEGLISEVDGMPALSIYERYLAVKPDSHFYENVCPFPFLTPTGERNIARVPLLTDGTGGLQFTMSVNCGEKVSLAYSKPEYLLAESLSCANAAKAFAPEALLLFVCMNRAVFMGNVRALQEIAYYEKALPSMCDFSGLGEILQVNDEGGITNSSLVCIGMREGAAAAGEVEPITDAALEGEADAIPLADRLVTFLECTTEDLRDTIAELEDIASVDQLTGIWNRRHLYELFERMLDEGECPAVLMYDIDHFKDVNDTYGHEVGDEVLKALTDCVASTVRSADVFGRWGGEEFLIIGGGMSLQDAAGFAERIRARVESCEFPHVGHVTVSMGVAKAGEGDTTTTLFQRVDRALYQAKNNGRNRIEIAQ